MRLRLVACSAFLLALLAGCSDPPADDESMPSSNPSSSTPVDSIEVAPRMPVTHTFDWNGSLVAGAWFCDGTATHQCMSQPAGSFGADLVTEGYAGNLTASQFTLTWTAATALTDDLVLEVHVFPACEDCEGAFASTQGTSPLSVELPIGTSFAPDDEFLVVVYSSKFVAQPGMAAGTSGAQDFHVVGSITLQQNDD